MASVTRCTSLLLSTIIQKIILGHSVVCLAVLQWGHKMACSSRPERRGGAWMGSHK